ncbi:MAG: helix-turn-helix transcriptional regulator [Erysipelotrichaceae bacterium]|nr:helix-turn-helix transcriptional regulator [Erysipelotrichaceae bacterium]
MEQTEQIYSPSLEVLFGKRIQQIRKEMNLSQKEFGELVGFHRTYIGQIERAEKCVSIKAIEQICKSLNISVQELFDFSNLK